MQEYADGGRVARVPSQFAGLSLGDSGSAANASMPIDCSPAIAPFVERILALSAAIADTAANIDRRADRLFGAVPEGGHGVNDRADIPGEIGRLARATDTLEHSIQRLLSADQRLSSL